MTDLSTKKLANMDIHRFLSAMPYWSSAYSNFFSNYSKMVSPVMSGVSSNLDTVDSVYTYFFSDNLFGYPKMQYYVPTFGTPSSVVTDLGPCEYIGEYGSCSLESYPISALRQATDPTLVLEDIDFEGMTIINPIMTTDAINLFVRCPTASVETPVLVELMGYDEDLNKCSESFVFSSNIATISSIKYRVVYEIRTSESIIIKSSMDLAEANSFSSKGGFSARIAKISGEYFDPYFYLEDNILHVKDGRSFARPDIFRFELDNIPEKIFITNLLDVLYLFENSIYSAKLSLDYYSISQPNSSANVNDFISIDDENTPVGDICTATVDIGKLLSEYTETNSIRIYIKNNGTKLYIDKNLAPTAESDTWIPVSYDQKKIRVQVSVEESTPYEFFLELDKDKKVFTAMTYVNLLSETEIETGIEDIALYDGKFLVKNTGEDFHECEAIRLAYMSQDSNIILFNNFETLDVDYE